MRSVPVACIFDLKIDEIDSMTSGCSDHVSLQLCDVTLKLSNHLGFSWHLPKQVVIFKLLSLLGHNSRHSVERRGNLRCSSKTFESCRLKFDDLSQCVSDFLEISYLSWHNFRFVGLNTNLLQLGERNMTSYCQHNGHRVTQRRCWLVKKTAATMMARVRTGL